MGILILVMLTPDAFNAVSSLFLLRIVKQNTVEINTVMGKAILTNHGKEYM